MSTHSHPSLSRYRIGRLKVPIDRITEHPKNPNSQLALADDPLGRQMHKKSLSAWNSFFQEKFNDQVYELKGIVVLRDTAPADAYSHLSQLFTQSGGEAALPTWVAEVQVLSGIHRFHCARTMNLSSLEFELFTAGKPLCAITRSMPD